MCHQEVHVQETGAVQHADDTANGFELLHGDFQPDVESLYYLRTDLLALVRDDVSIRLQYRLCARQAGLLNASGEGI